MAFPVLVTSDSKSGTGDGTGYSANYPDNLVSGDLILFLHANRGRSNNTVPGEFVGLNRPQGGGGSSGAQSSMMWGKRVSNGTESGGTFTVSMGTSASYEWYVLRITGWYGTLGTTFDNSASAGSVEMIYAEGNSNTPDPPNVDPNNWDTEDTLWLTNVCIREASGGLVSYSQASYQEILTLADIRHARSGEENSVGSLNPSAFVFGGGDDWITSTIAIRPAAPPPPPTVYPISDDPPIGFAGRGAA